MALTRHQLRELKDETLQRIELRPAGAPGAPGASPRLELRAWATEPAVVSRRWGGALGVAWVLVYMVAVLVEPAPASARAGDPVWAVALFVALSAALVGMGAGLARGRRIGLLAGVAATGLALVGAVMCPVSAHHTAIGAWWFLQMAGFAGLMGATLVALRRSRAS